MEYNSRFIFIWACINCKPKVWQRDFKRICTERSLGVNAMESHKSLYDLVVVDSKGIEMDFSNQLESRSEVAVYTKLPNGFYINTLMGKYFTDWAVAFREGSVKHVYFVAESKGNDLQGSQLRGSEESKIECARRHFKAISDNGYIYDVAKDYKSLYDIVTK